MSGHTTCKYGHLLVPENVYLDPGKGTNHCRMCRKEASRRSYLANKEKIIARSRRYHKEHKDKLRESKRKAQQKYRESFPDRIRASKRGYYERNASSIKEAQRIYRQRNPELCREKSRRYYARKNKCVVESIPKNWENILLIKQEGLCFYCGCDLAAGFHLEHKTPLSRAGEHSKKNTVLSCPECNMCKHTRTAEEFIEYLKGLEVEDAKRIQINRPSQG